MKAMLLFCKKYMGYHRTKLAMYILLCITFGILSLAMPLVSGNFVDYLISGNNIHILLWYSALYFLIKLGSIFLGYVSNRLYISLQTKMGFELNRDVISHIQHLPLSYIEEQNSAYMNQKVNNDSNTLMTFCISIIQNVVINLVTFFLSLATIFLYDPIIAISLLILIPCYFLAYRVLKGHLFASSFRLKEQQSSFFSKLYEQFSHIKQVRLNAICTQFISRLNDSFERVLCSALQYQKISYIFTGLDGIILSISYIFLFIYGGAEVLNGKLSVGQFTIISSYFGIMMSSSRYFFSLGKTVQDNMVSYKRLEDIISKPSEPTGGIIIENISKITVHDLSKSFGQKCIFDSFSAKFVRGKIYAIVGANGSGKTTLINLILGLYVGDCPNSIQYNDVPIESINLSEAYQYSFGIVEQEPLLFEDTIEFNITLGSFFERKEQLEYYIKLLGLDSFISAVPNGFQTIIGEKASNISGGEKQKICLIRALLKNPDVLILDEPTSALDIESADKLKKHLSAIKKDKIIIIITHDTSFNDIADNVIPLHVDPES